MKSILGRLPATCSIKTFLFVVAGVITVQYLVNFTVYFHDKSPFFRWKITYWRETWNKTGTYGSVTMEIERRMNLSECPVIPPGLQGRVMVNTQIPAWAHIEEDNPNVTSGGRYKPQDCIARHRVAIVIPYRDREIHLKLFLQNLHPFLQRQQLDYGIYVVEMAHGVKFNRALLMNAGFAEAVKQYDYQCFIFHDVDLLPEDDRNLYTCPSMPRHMSTAIDKLKYMLPYPQIFGGVSAIPTNQFRLINGFSNLYFGWGGEDDDMYRRIIYSNLTVIRYSDKVARYKMLVHKKASGNPERFSLLKTVKRRRGSDGLSSLKYKIIKLEKKPLFTWILVSVNMSEVLDGEHIHKQAMRPGHLPPGKNNQQQQQRQQQQQQPFPNNMKSGQSQLGQKAAGGGKQNNTNWGPAMGKKKSPVAIDWVPPDYTGKLPDYLTKYESANFVFQPVPKVAKPAKYNKLGVNKRPVVQQKVARQAAGKGVNSSLSHDQRLQQLKQEYIRFRKHRMQNQHQKLIQSRMNKPYNNIPVQTSNAQYFNV